MKTMSAVAKRTAIYFLRNDLRIHDNESLIWANRNADHIIPLYCFDPEHYKGTHHFNFPKTGVHRAKFIIQCVKDLRASLQRVGSNLIVRHENPITAIGNLIELCKSTAPVTSVVYQKEVTKEETDVEGQISAFCKKLCIDVQVLWGSTLFHPEDIPFSSQSIPNTYTEFRKRVENTSQVRNLIAVPDHIKPLPPVKGKLGDVPSMADLGIVENSDPDRRSAFDFEGGESAALERLKHYLWKTDAISAYKETRNGLIGADYSTKFSPWLATGSLSPRQIYHSIKKYENERTANQSTYWVIFELMWRDYFKFVCKKYGNHVFFASGIMGKKVPWKTDIDLFHKWSQGMTGVPFVDANMRELLATGWMSNRGRQNVASFLLKDLGLDWRLGAEWFESLLLDHDVCSNYGNWNYAAGIGNDPRENRKFNMIKQAIDYDGDGDFVRLWVPEVSKLQGGDIHAPWTLPASSLHAAEIELGRTYPHPLVSPPEWSKHLGKKRATGQSGGAQKTKKSQRGMDFYFKSQFK